MPTPRELEILDSYLDPPDELDDYFDKYWDVMSDLLYEEMRENEVLSRE